MSDTSKQVIENITQLAADVILYASKSGLPRSVVDQLTRSISSIGANFSEAQDASSKKDFINKIYIAKKEANESIYWLKLSSKLSATVEINEIEGFIERTQGYLMMLQKIINSSRITK